MSSNKHEINKDDILLKQGNKYHLNSSNHQSKCSNYVLHDISIHWIPVLLPEAKRYPHKCWCICEPMYRGPSRGPCIGTIYPTLLGFGGIHPLFSPTTITELSNYQFTSGMITIILPLQHIYQTTAIGSFLVSRFSAAFLPLWVIYRYEICAVLCQT